jgi:hypothetical protein
MKHVAIAFGIGTIIAAIVMKSMVLGVIGGLAGFGLFMIIELLRASRQPSDSRRDPAQARQDIRTAFDKHLALDTFEDATPAIASMMITMGNEEMFSILALAAYCWKKEGTDPDTAFVTALATEATRNGGGEAAGEATMLWNAALNWGNSVGERSCAWGVECVAKAAGRIP